MPAMFVVDASVVVDFIAPTADSADSADSENFMRGLSWPHPITLMAPDVLFLEAANALRKLMLQRAIRKDRADLAAAALARMPIASVTCASVLEAAWSLRGNVTPYDGAYLSLARDLDVPYVTRDRPASRAATKLGIRAWHVGDPGLEALLDALEPPESKT